MNVVAPEAQTGPQGFDGRSSRVAAVALPRWLKLSYSLFLAVLVPVYWRHYGPSNFLWACDLALFLILASLWTERPLANSMAVIGVLPFQLAWCVDFLAGSRLLGMAAYMFEPDRPLFLKGLSLFHVGAPGLAVFLLCRLGYDRRALWTQTLFAWMVLLATFLLTDPADNINLAFGLGPSPQQHIDPRAFLLLWMAALPLLVFWPMHRLIRRLTRRELAQRWRCLGP